MTECGLQRLFKLVTNVPTELTQQASKMRDEFHRALPMDKDFKGGAADGAAINNNDAATGEVALREDTVPSMSGRPSVDVDGE